jgi:glycerol 3-phosphatase-2
MLRRCTDVDPPVAGKPSPPLLQAAIRRTQAARPLMVGDRLDTDIAGAHAVGIDSLLVLTGVTGLAQLVAATPAERPSHLAADLTCLIGAPASAVVTAAPDRVACGGWIAQTSTGDLTLSGAGTINDWWRAAAAASWAFSDRHHRHVGLSLVTEPR